MKSSNYKILQVVILCLVISIICICIARMCYSEKYIKLKDVGKSQILYNTNSKKTIYEKPENIYDSHRYKQKRPYNFLSQQNSRNQ
jgi:uncharacterized membrane protein